MWPSDFPEQCPPANARSEEVYVYRLVSNSPPKREDFLTTKQEWPARIFEKPDDKCNSCGVSVFKQRDDAEKKRLRYKALRSKSIAHGKIEPSDGVVLETYAPSHMTWWLKTEEPHRNFAVAQANLSATAALPANIQA